VVIVIVEVQVGVQEGGLKEAEAPEGNPEAEKLTDEAGPALIKVAVIVVVTEPPFPQTRPEFGLAEREKSATTRQLVDTPQIVSEPSVAQTVRLNRPVGADEATESVSVVEQSGVQEGGLKEQLIHQGYAGSQKKSSSGGEP